MLRIYVPDAIVRRLLAEGRVSLESLGQETFPVDDAETAYEALKSSESKPLLVLLSYPEREDAATRTTRLRTLEPYKRLPVIALAEHGANMGEAEALAAGATRVFDRGLATEEDLFLALRTALR